MSRYRFIDAERGHYPVRRLCQVRGVPTSGFYAWQAGQQPAGTLAWETLLVKVFRYHQRRYGTRRLHVVLRQKGHWVGRQRLRAALRRRGLHGGLVTTGRKITLSRRGSRSQGVPRLA